MKLILVLLISLIQKKICEMSFVPNSDIDKDIRHFYKKIDNNVIFSNLNNKEILDNNSGNAQFEGSLLNAVNSYYDENESSINSNSDKLINEIGSRVGVQKIFCKMDII